MTAISGTESGRKAGSVLANSGVLIGSYAVTRLVAFVSIVYMAQVLGTDTFGQVNFAQVVVVYATLLTNLGLMSLGTRDVAQDPAQVRYITANFLALRLVLALGSYLLLALVTVFLPIPPTGRVLVLLFGLSVFPTAATLDWVFKGVERMGVVAVIEIFRTVPFLLFLVCGVTGPGQVFRVAAAYCVAMVIMALFSLLAFRRCYGSIQLGRDFTFWRSSLRAAWPLGIAFIMVQVYYLTDTLVLGFLKGNTLVGWYSASYKIIAFIQGVGGWFFEASFPVVSRLFKTSTAGLRSLLSGSAELTIGLVMPIAAGGAILARPLIVGFYGADYEAGVIAFQILLFAISIELIGMLFGYSLMACNRLRQYLISVTVGAATSVTMNLLLIPRFGLTGAGLARLLSEIVITICFVLQFRSVLKFPVARHFLKPAVATAVMASAVLWVSGHWILRMVLGAVVYFGAFILLSLRQDTPWYLPLKQLTVEPAERAPVVSPTLEHEAF